MTKQGSKKTHASSMMRLGIVACVALAVPLLAAASVGVRDSANPTSPVISSTPSAIELPYYQAFSDRGDANLVERSRDIVGSALTNWEAQFRVPADADSRIGRKAALTRSKKVAKSKIAVGSVAEDEAADVQQDIVNAPDAITYSDNSFVLDDIVGVDASDAGSILVVVNGHMRFFDNENEAAGILAAGWVDGPTVQWQVRFASHDGILELASVDQKSPPGAPSP